LVTISQVSGQEHDTIPYWRHMPYALQTNSVTGKCMPY